MPGSFAPQGEKGLTSGQACEHPAPGSRPEPPPVIYCSWLSPWSPMIHPRHLTGLVTQHVRTWTNPAVWCPRLGRGKVIKQFPKLCAPNLASLYPLVKAHFFQQFVCATVMAGSPCPPRRGGSRSHLLRNGDRDLCGCVHSSLCNNRSSWGLAQGYQGMLCLNIKP